jgi:hypothetical protein
VKIINHLLSEDSSRMCSTSSSFLVAFDARCEMLAVGLAQGRDEGIAVLAADFAILVAMTLIAGLFHGWFTVYSQAINHMRFSYPRTWSTRPSSGRDTPIGPAWLAAGGKCRFEGSARIRTQAGRARRRIQCVARSSHTP